MNMCTYGYHYTTLSKCASASSGFPENSSLKCDQFKCGICCTCFVGCC